MIDRIRYGLRTVQTGRHSGESQPQAGTTRKGGKTQTSSNKHQSRPEVYRKTHEKRRGIQLSIRNFQTVTASFGLRVLFGAVNSTNRPKNVSPSFHAIGGDKWRLAGIDCVVEIWTRWRQTAVLVANSFLNFRWTMFPKDSFDTPVADWIDSCLDYVL